jgi:6-phosphogluconolactonase
MTIDIQRFDNRETMLDALFQVIVGDIETALQRNSSATLLLSGGSTPAPLYMQLSRARVDWGKVHIALVDERWVSADNPASNERLLHETLLVNHAETARFTGMKNAADSAFDGVQACNLEYAKLPLPHTVCLLGMGPDGHTASLFPQAQGLAEALAAHQHCAAIRAQQSAVTGELIERMTMTPWSILQSERLILLITGADKWEVLQQARACGDATLMPISHFIDSKIPLEVYWAP